MRLPASVQEHLEAGRLTAGHARSLLDLDDAPGLAERIIKQGLNVRQTEALAKRAREGAVAAGPRSKGTPVKDADARDLERNLGNVLGSMWKFATRAALANYVLHKELRAGWTTCACV